MPMTAAGTPTWLNRVLLIRDLWFGVAVRGLLEAAILAANSPSIGSAPPDLRSTDIAVDVLA
jgi:hypothetical protein